MTAPAAGSLQITWPAVAGKTYQIWTSTNLTNWSFYQSVTAASTGNQVLPVTTGGATNLYVRVTTGP